jgi:gamma-butyrobetaine dioxygenase
VFAVSAIRQGCGVSTIELPHTLPAISAGPHGRGVRLSAERGTVDLDPHWLRDRSIEPGQIEETNRQRLFTPVDIDADLTVVSCSAEETALAVTFSDGHAARLPLATLLRDLGWIDDPERPPAAIPWTRPLADFPYVDWAGIGWNDDESDVDAVIEFLTAFYRHGYVVFRNTPTDEGTVARIANRIGYISGNNFGWVFDVRAEQRPTDLAYTPIELLAHTDEPYRIEPPGIQLLHCLANEAPGGNSTLVDGLAAAQAIAAERPDLHTALRDVEVEFRYDMGTDTVVNRGRILEYDRNGNYAAIRFNTKIDAALAVPGVDLAPWYEGRRWLARWLNDPAHQVTFRLEPGDVMFMDNHRALHGRTAFDPSKGRRHLQGCYIEHNGPDTMYRLAVRRRAKLTP